MESNNITLRFLLQETFSTLKENKWKMTKWLAIEYILIYTLTVLIPVSFTYEEYDKVSISSLFYHALILTEITLIITLSNICLYVIYKDKLNGYSFKQVIPYYSISVCLLQILSFIFTIVLCRFSINIVIFNLVEVINRTKGYSNFDLIKIGYFGLGLICITSSFYIPQVITTCLLFYKHIKNISFKKVIQVFSKKSFFKMSFIYISSLIVIFTIFLKIAFSENIMNSNLNYNDSIGYSYIYIFILIVIIFSLIVFNNTMIVIYFKHLIKNKDIELEAKINEIGILEE